jgi:hypothetical protein
MSRVIIPGVTPCCAPPAPHCDICSETHLEIDGDCVLDGDVLVCPEHHESIIWTFTKGWWTDMGGSFEENPVWNTTICLSCRKVWSITAWSYRG